jgi:hypothetical protein
MPTWGTDALGATKIRVSRATAQKMGHHLEAINRSMEVGSGRPLRDFARRHGIVIRDLHHQRFTLRTDFDELLAEWFAMSDEEQDAVLDEIESP